MLTAALLTIAVTAAVSELVLGVGTTLGWLRYMPTNTARYVDDERNISMVRIMRLVLPSTPSLLAGIVVSIIFALPFVKKLRERESGSQLLPVMLLASPLTWRYYLGLLSMLSLTRIERICLAVPPVILLLGILEIIPSQNLIPAVEKLLVLLVQLPLLMTLFMVWYRTASPNRSSPKCQQ
jgi:hypothetical protein